MSDIKFFNFKSLSAFSKLCLSLKNMIFAILCCFILSYMYIFYIYNFILLLTLNFTLYIPNIYILENTLRLF